MAVTQPVLLVEDDLDTQEALSEAIVGEGHTVVAVADGNAALEYLVCNPHPCLILLDWHMRGMSGIDLISELRKTPVYERIPLVLMSGDPRAFRQVGGPPLAGHLTKPFELEDLLHLVTRHCPLDTEGCPDAAA